MPVPSDVMPVPPLATGRVPVTLVVRFTKVVEVLPVPPLATGRVPVTAVERLMFVSVLLAPLIVLLVSVCVFDAVSTFDGVMIPDSVVI
jgi:hypothetical protein